MKRRKVFVPTEPRAPLTREEILQLVEEGERMRKKMEERLERLHHFEPGDFQIRVK